MKESRKKRAHVFLFYLYKILENADYKGKGDSEELYSAGDGYVYYLDYGDGFMEVCVCKTFHMVQFKKCVLLYVNYTSIQLLKEYKKVSIYFEKQCFLKDSKFNFKQARLNCCIQPTI